MAQLKNITISDTGSIALPSGTTAQQPATPLQGMIRYNSTLSTAEYYDGLAWRSISDSDVEATGGTIIDTEIGGVAYRIHQFTTTGNSTFTVTRPGEVEYLIVAGGGGGSDTGSGGGGAGGFLTGFTTVTPQAYTITVGSGGAGTNSYSSGTSGQTGGKGGNSVALGFTAFGGGGGGGYRSAANAPELSGGSGGGHRGTNGGVGGLGTPGQGNNGGTSSLGNGDAASGGGGAGGVGGNAVTGRGGHGGVGLVSLITGIAKFYAGGGGGSGGYGSTAGIGLGGLGGGGNGGGVSRFFEDPFIQNGFPNTGGGGGGQGYNGSTDPVQGGGNGGSGIVVIRYRRNLSTTTPANQIISSSLPFNYNYTSDVRSLIVREGLVVDLDSANPLSYPGSGTTWNDLSGNGNNGTLVNFGGPGAGTTSGFDTNTKLMMFDRRLGAADGVANNYVNISNSASLRQCLPVNGMTIDMWVMINTPTCGVPTKWDGSWEIYYCPTLVWRTQGTGGNDGNSGVQSTTYQKQLHNIVATHSGTERRFYINGTLIYTNANTVTAQNTTNPVGIGAYHGGSYAIIGALPVYRLYNRVLSNSEVQQNFNALRGRYGI
jgi:hypothetical protein